MTFLVPNYSCPRTPDKGATAPRSPFSLSSTEFVEHPPNKIPGYATALRVCSLIATRKLGWNTAVGTVGRSVSLFPAVSLQCYAEELDLRFSGR